MNDNANKGNKARIYNLIIVDESGSMGGLEHATITGVNETINSIRSAQRDFGATQEHFLTLNLPPKIGVLGLAFYVNDMFYFLITGLEKDVVTTLFLTKTIPESIYTVVIGGILFYLTSGKKSDV